MHDIQTANSVKLARIAARLTQQELADRAGVTRQTIGLIEANQYNPSIKLCLMLASITGKSLSELFWIASPTDDPTPAVR